MTIKDSKELNVASALFPGGIEAQEARGQTRLNNSTYLPWDMPRVHTDRGRSPLDNEALMIAWRAVLQNWGATSELKVVDDLFFEVKLPHGWTKVASDHSMWSEVRDTRNIVRAHVFYKAASYDRNAHLSLTTRYQLREELVVPDDYSGDRRIAVLDSGTGQHLIEIQFKGPASKSDADRKKYYADSDAAQNGVVAYLNEHYPAWLDPMKYWD